MGSGKTTVGAALARARGGVRVALAAGIEARAGTSVREIFATEGEPRFRELEQEALRSTGRLEEAVVATGGGTFTFPANQELMRRLGVSVFLHPPFAVIMRRIGAMGKADRPLFRDETQALALYRDRLPAYHQADLTIDVSGDETPEETAARIALLLAARGVPCDI